MDTVGVLLNLLFVPGALFMFVYLAAQRLDKQNEISFFLLFLPIWIAALPVCAYIILNGLAAQNSRIERCEKLTLSLCVPLGFLTTLILLVVYIEGHFPTSEEELGGRGQPNWLFVIFLPHLLSLLCLYLYLRCLVRPVRVHNLGAKAEIKN